MNNNSDITRDIINNMVNNNSLPENEDDRYATRASFVMVVNVYSEDELETIRREKLNMSEYNGRYKDIIPVIITFDSYPDNTIAEYHWNVYSRRDEIFTNTIFEYGGGIFNIDEEKIDSSSTEEYSQLICRKILHNRFYDPDEVSIKIMSMIMYIKTLADEIDDDNELVTSIKNISHSSLIDTPIFKTFFVDDIDATTESIIINPNTDNETKKSILRIRDAVKRANLYE